MEVECSPEQFSAMNIGLFNFTSLLYPHHCHRHCQPPLHRTAYVHIYHLKRYRIMAIKSIWWIIWPIDKLRKFFFGSTSTSTFRILEFCICDSRMIINLWQTEYIINDIYDKFWPQIIHFRLYFCCCWCFSFENIAILEQQISKVSSCIFQTT